MPDEHESMAQHPMPAPAPVVAPSASGMFLKREMNGASFLSLEHVAHMVLVVVVAALVAGGLTLGLSLWTGAPMAGGSYSLLLSESAMQSAAAMGAVGIVAALLVLAPLLMVLDRRTRAEWMKRHGYSGRVAYKVPVYTALGVLVAAKLMAVIAMVGVVLTSLVSIGVPNAGIGSMYLTQFVPAAITAVVFGLAAWYVFKLAKGRDMGRQFSLLMVFAAGVLSLALLITAVSVMHSNKNESLTPYPYTMPNNSNSNRSLEDLFNY
jgi:hypothetical protein